LDIHVIWRRQEFTQDLMGLYVRNWPFWGPSEIVLKLALLRQNMRLWKVKECEDMENASQNVRIWKMRDRM
jgi:hypothetical protein